MGRKKALIDKKIFKKAEGKCRICGESDYAVLDIHRLLTGSQGGRYTKYNSVSCCANCHRRVHDGQIILDRYFHSTGGKMLLRAIIDGKEVFL